MSETTQPAKSQGPVVLVILDGWGLAPPSPTNAVTSAETPVMDRLWQTYPHTTLRTSGEAVGLPEGQMGNSEVGHLNLGAGFVVYQWITRIDKAIEDRSLFANEALMAAMDGCRSRGGKLHLLGLVSEGGVHSHSRHLLALLHMAQERDVPRTFVHAFTDGRDTPPESGLGSILGLQEAMRQRAYGRVASISGRYYAMDRDKRWDRTRLAYEAIVDANAPSFTSAGAAIEASYRAGVTDEFIVPCLVQPPGSEPVRVEPDDAVIFFNFRADRARQLTRALSLPDFTGFERSRVVAETVPVTTMTRYEEGLPVAVAFEPHDVVWPVARVVSEAGLKQFHAAETEKYAHVTFFFNGGREEPFPGETRNLTPSPKVATYDLQPEMSAIGVTDAVVAAIDSGEYAFVIVNYANGDMVGHTGVFAAAKAAIETVDACLGRVVEATLAHGGVCLVTADHGNAEEMVDPATGQVWTAHTTNPVPAILVSSDGSRWRHATLREGSPLSAVAPAVLQLLGLPVPSEMTTPSLIESAPSG